MSTTPTPHALAEALRAMRRNAGRHMPTGDGRMRWSIILDDVMIGHLTDAADVIDQIAEDRAKAMLAEPGRQQEGGAA